MTAPVAPAVLDWLLAGDPAIRWQVLRDLTDAPAHDVETERARVATTGLGAAVLARQGDDGTWAGVAWNHGWTSTMHALTLLHACGLDPASPDARRAMARIVAHVTWAGAGPDEVAHHRYFEGETEPCINGQVAAAGAWFGQDVGALVNRLLDEQLADGGWNCEAERGSVRGSFHTTICVLEALLARERQLGGDARLAAARARGEAWLLDRHLFKRRTTGAPPAYEHKRRPTMPHGVVPFTRLAFPHWWHHDILRGLDYLREAGIAPDARVHDAVAMLEAKRGADGRWVREIVYEGDELVPTDDGVGAPSRWITLKALRVLRWAGVR